MCLDEAVLKLIHHFGSGVKMKCAPMCVSIYVPCDTYLSNTSKYSLSTIGECNEPVKLYRWRRQILTLFQLLWQIPLKGIKVNYILK